MKSASPHSAAERQEILSGAVPLIRRNVESLPPEMLAGVARGIALALSLVALLVDEETATDLVMALGGIAKPKADS